MLASGFISRSRWRKASTFTSPMVRLVAISCRLQLVTHTRSLSTMVMLRMPLRTSPSAHHEPTPPMPKMSTRADCSFSRLSFPRSSSVRRCIPRSIVVILFSIYFL